VKNVVDPEQYRERENQLQVALENKAQAVLLRYLAGDETPQSVRSLKAARATWKPRAG